ncbi:MAG: phospho-N-acetylmuramoyl-pentapeptide-transferase [Clostridia bacterium]
MDMLIMLVAGFALSALLGPLLIPFLKRLKVGQTVRDDGPKTHFVKSGTPTMGGLIFLIPVLLGGAVLSFFQPSLIPVVVSTFFFGLIGFLDDYLKVVRKHKNGLSIKQKSIMIVLFSLAFSFYTLFFTNLGFDIWLPVIGVVNSQIFYVIFVLVYFFGTTNAVNFADGLDGLLAGLMILVMLFLVFMASLVPLAWNGYGQYAALLAGGCMGFLLYNRHPAKVFMGDTGSLALGGALAALLLMMKSPLLIFVVGAVFVIEGLSVAIQVFYFKTTGKRFFKMAPIHHHFELMGWKETTVVAVFWAVCLVTCVIGAVIVTL